MFHKKKNPRETIKYVIVNSINAHDFVALHADRQLI